MNTATAEESASASEELSSQAELLKDMVRKFELKRNGNIVHTNEYKSKRNINIGQEEVAVSSMDEDIMIDLDDKEFGKY